MFSLFRPLLHLSEKHLKHSQCYIIMKNLLLTLYLLYINIHSKQLRLWTIFNENKILKVVFKHNVKALRIRYIRILFFTKFQNIYYFNTRCAFTPFSPSLNYVKNVPPSRISPLKYFSVPSPTNTSLQRSFDKRVTSDRLCRVRILCDHFGDSFLF